FADQRARAEHAHFYGVRGRPAVRPAPPALTSGLAAWKAEGATTIIDVHAPLRLAIVGSGPAGFYAAGALLDADEPIEVDMIERLPTPWGLVRLGVAPDHPKLKTVSRAYERIAVKPGFRFLGNVEVGGVLTHADLERLYDAVIYAVGAQTDRRLGIPGEDLPGSWSATEFVAW